MAFNTAVGQYKRVFVVTANPPVTTRRTRVSQASLFGVVLGYWVVAVGKELVHAA